MTLVLNVTSWGCSTLAESFFRKARKFLRAAIEHKEIPRYYFPGGTESQRLVRFAMCEWFVNRKHDLEVWNKASNRGKVAVTTRSPR